ncbi:hypothetical protein RIR_jg842.t1 [Rhizophagus irregularis DAOM 181602=DAOM 197198]|nr:hypothetical protein RIR_jg842.t1 [Rhizophagus irregularis DAOM 181602=DAOM 197198]
MPENDIYWFYILKICSQFAFTLLLILGFESQRNSEQFFLFKNWNLEFVRDRNTPKHQPVNLIVYLLYSI